MSVRLASSQTRLALIAGSDETSVRALQSVLQPAGYRVLQAATQAAALAQARRGLLDVILVFEALGEDSGVRLSAALRHDAAVIPGVPILGFAPGVVARELRLDWLRAGAWDVFRFPVDAEELLFKLDSYLRETDRLRAGLLVDQVTGLYTAPGVRRRAGELIAAAVRGHGALACLVFRPDVVGGAGAGAGTETEEERAALRARLGAVLRAQGRVSDTIGWWNGAGSEFAVLAPATNAAGAEHLAARLAHAIEAGAAAPRLVMRVGYEAVPDVHAQPLDADQLLGRAVVALGSNRGAAPGERIRRFQSL